MKKKQKQLFLCLRETETPPMKRFAKSIFQIFLIFFTYFINTSLQIKNQILLLVDMKTISTRETERSPKQNIAFLFLWWTISIITGMTREFNCANKRLINKLQKRTFSKLTFSCLLTLTIIKQFQKIW